MYLYAKLLNMKSVLLLFISCFITMSSWASISPITGPNIVCQGAGVTLSNATPGGVWSSSSSAIATVGYYNGSVLGVHAGSTTITYIAAGDTATTTMYVAPYVAPISGSITSVCTGKTITLNNAIAGGTWTTYSGNATVTDGIVTGVTAGTDTVYYTMNYTCGTAVTKKVVTVKQSPILGPITGNTMACNSLTDTLSDTTAGGIWSSSTSAIASISAFGVVTGRAVGTATITYGKTVSGCFSRSLLPITVNALPNPGIITGTSGVCVNATISLGDTTSGGIWSATNGLGTITSSGVFTGLSAGVDTILYSRTNSCATVSAKKYISVYALPVAGTIVAPLDSVCVNAYDTLQATNPGGIWGKTNSFASVTTGGVVKGLAKGVDTIRYTMTSSHGCPSAVTTHVISVLALPVVAGLTGASSLCAGSTIIIASTTAGGTWSNNNLLLDTVDATTGIVRTIAAGRDTISYTMTNYCGSVSKTKSILINPLPDAGTISGTDSNVCVNATITLSSSASGGGWGRSNTHVLTFSNGVMKGVSPGLDTIRYVVNSTLGCGKDTASLVVTVNPLPNSGIITGPTIVCIGMTITLVESTTGGVWIPSSSNIFISDAGVISPFATGRDTVMYVATTLLCGNDTSFHPIQVQSAENCRAAVSETELTDAGFKIYPNPNGENTLSVETGYANQTTVCVISDITGRQRNLFQITGRHTEVDISGLPKGVYVVTGYTVNGQMTAAFKMVRE